MTTIRTNCPSCGEVDMSPEAVLLSVRDIAGEGSYRFSCPECRKTVEKPADRKVVALLLSAGVELDEGREPAPVHAVETSVYEDRPDGPPFTVDDIITFHFLLEDDEELYRALPSA
ncbi:MAG TPA: hypothetical protein VHI54_09920 [Actinomycetota bacterium]|nr:hypothetical protein [Actinomycetota bacterium]